jgi:uncharacterized protein YqhQ
MKKIFLNQFILFLSKTSIMVGGQAVINGVMMRVPGFYATAVRNADSEIIIARYKHQSLVENYNLTNIPIIRGFLHLVDSMKIGFKTLEWSAEIAEENTSPNKIINFFMTLLSISFAIGLFMGIPYLITEFTLSVNNFSNNQFLFNSFAGLLRMIMFLLYLYLISQLEDIMCLFQYHGAEHKVVYNFEAGTSLSIENAQKFSTKHPRCGTSFVFILMLVTIFTYAITDSVISALGLLEFTIPIRILFHLLLLPFVAGLGYEVLKFLARKQTNIFFAMLSKPGLWLQNITTKEPSDEQVEVSLAALKSAFDNQMSKFKGQQFNADAIG